MISKYRKARYHFIYMYRDSQEKNGELRGKLGKIDAAICKGDKHQRTIKWSPIVNSKNVIGKFNQVNGSKIVFQMK